MLQDFRNMKDILYTCLKYGGFVLANFKLSAPGSSVYWGHVSPIAAYDEHSDRFLILDVHRTKGEPYWI